MTTQVNIHEAKTHLSRLLEAVERGEEVVIARAGKPIARLSPFKPPRRKIQPPRNVFGSDWVVPDDFDDAFELLPATPEAMREAATVQGATDANPGNSEQVIIDLIRRATAGEEIVLSAEGEPDVRLVAVRRTPSADEKRRILEDFQSAAAAKGPWDTTAARSQDFLYDDDGLPEEAGHHTSIDRNAP